MNSIEGINGVAQVSQVHPVEQIIRNNEYTETFKDDVSTGEKANLYVSKGNKELLRDAVEDANYRLKETKRHCEFSFVEEANRIAIKVVDSETDEVVREIPSEDELKMIENLREMAGLLLDYKL